MSCSLIRRKMSPGGSVGALTNGACLQTIATTFTTMQAWCRHLVTNKYIWPATNVKVFLRKTFLKALPAMAFEFLWARIVSVGTGAARRATPRYTALHRTAKAIPSRTTPTCQLTANLWKKSFSLRTTRLRNPHFVTPTPKWRMPDRN